jgi:TolB-like protein/DNA-binding SARP family transcriptional activator/Flp pilus assembly protein TadD
MLHLKTFGGLSVHVDGAPGAGAAQQRKTLALLALLGAAGQRGLSRDKLIAALWPEADAEHGRGLLKQACYALRRDLHAPELFLGSIQLRLNPAVISTDVEAFVSALQENDPTRAVSLYTAPFLDGFYLNGGGEFENWAETERARLASRCRAALEVLSAEATRRSEHQVAAGWWRRLLELDPLSSHAALGLMTALDNGGELADALRCGQAYGELVRSELSSDPPPELTEWIEQRRHVARNGARPPKPLPVPAATVEGKGATAGVQGVPDRLIPRLHRTYVLNLTAAGAVVLLLAGAGYAVWRQHGTAGAAEPVAAPAQKMLAVLPFENRGPAADDYFADGLTEAIGLRLGGVRSIGVIAAQSARQYKGTGKSLAQIGRELGVQYVLQGSVWWEKTAGASRVRVSPRLIRVSDGRQLWAAQYDTVLTAMFALQTSLATKVAGALDVTLLTAERRRLEAPTANPEAYDAFLSGVQAVEDGSGSPAGMRKVVGLFERAVALDSTFVTAYAYLSIAHVIMYLSYLDRDVDQLRRAKAALDPVRQLDPECDSGSCVALGFYQLFVLQEYDSALRAFTRARQVRPSDPTVPGLIAHVYRRRGQWSEALAYLREAVRLNPLNADEAGDIGRVYAVLRQFPAANYYLDRALAATPHLANARLVKGLAYLNLSGDLEGTRRFLPDVSENISPTGIEDVIISLQDIVLLLSDQQQTRLLQLTPAALEGDTAALALAKALIHQRRNHRALARASFDSARVVLQEKVRRHPDDDPFYHAMLGLALAGLEHPDQAVREGERAIALLPYPAGGAESTLMPANLARIHLLLGHREQAIDLLTAVFSRPGPLSAAWLRVDPFWDPLRASLRFQRLEGVHLAVTSKRE